MLYLLKMQGLTFETKLLLRFKKLWYPINWLILNNRPPSAGQTMWLHHFKLLVQTFFPAIKNLFWYWHIWETTFVNNIISVIDKYWAIFLGPGYCYPVWQYELCCSNGHWRGINLAKFTRFFTLILAEVSLTGRVENVTLEKSFLITITNSNECF